MTTFDEDFRDFISQRISISYSKMLNGNSEPGKRHKYYSEKYLKLEKEICERLGATDEAFELLFNLSDVKGLLDSIEMDAFYLQGLQDGISLVRILNEGITWPVSRDRHDQVND